MIKEEDNNVVTELTSNNYSSKIGNKDEYMDCEMEEIVESKSHNDDINRYDDIHIKYPLTTKYSSSSKHGQLKSP